MADFRRMAEDLIQESYLMTLSSAQLELDMTRFAEECAAELARNPDVLDGSQLGSFADDVTSGLIGDRIRIMAREIKQLNAEETDPGRAKESVVRMVMYAKHEILKAIEQHAPIAARNIRAKLDIVT